MPLQSKREGNEANFGEGNWKDMGNIYVNECANNTESQNWFVMADGRIALEPSGQSKWMGHFREPRTPESPRP